MKVTSWGGRDEGGEESYRWERKISLWRDTWSLNGFVSSIACDFGMPPQTDIALVANVRFVNISEYVFSFFFAVFVRWISSCTRRRVCRRDRVLRRWHRRWWVAVPLAGLESRHLRQRHLRTQPSSHKWCPRDAQIPLKWARKRKVSQVRKGTEKNPKHTNTNKQKYTNTNKNTQTQTNKNTQKQQQQQKQLAFN